VFTQGEEFLGALLMMAFLYLGFKEMIKNRVNGFDPVDHIGKPSKEPDS